MHSRKRQARDRNNRVRSDLGHNETPRESNGEGTNDRQENAAPQPISPQDSDVSMT